MQFQSLLAQSLGKVRTPIVPIPQSPSFLHPFEQHFSQLKLVDISWGEAETHDHARLADAQVGPQAVEGLLGHLVVTEGRFLF